MSFPGWTYLCAQQTQLLNHQCSSSLLSYLLWLMTTHPRSWTSICLTMPVLLQHCMLCMKHLSLQSTGFHFARSTRLSPGHQLHTWPKQIALLIHATRKSGSPWRYTEFFYVAHLNLIFVFLVPGTLLYAVVGFHISSLRLSNQQTRAYYLSYFPIFMFCRRCIKI